MIIRKAIQSCMIIYSATFMVSCISSGLTVTEVLPKEGKASLVGSINHVKGAKIIAYITKIDGNAIEVQRGYNRKHKTVFYLQPGEHNITIEARQGRNAITSFNINTEAGKTYVAQAIPLSISEMQVWVAELNSSKPVTKKKTVLKGKDGMHLGIVNELMYRNDVCKKYPDNEICK